MTIISHQLLVFELKLPVEFQLDFLLFYILEINGFKIASTRQASSIAWQRIEIHRLAFLKPFVVEKRPEI